MNHQGRKTIAASYDIVAEEYARRIYGELAHKPFDCGKLSHFAGLIRDQGHIVDMGCGPGHVTRFVKDLEKSVCGIDISPGMVDIARRLHPDIAFVTDDMENLSATDDSWSGMTAFYSLIHIPRQNVIPTLSEFARVLEPNSPLLLAFHCGDEVIHLDTWWSHPVDINFYFFQTDEVLDWLRLSGFRIDYAEEREPYSSNIEHQSRRAYVLARSLKV